MTATPLGTCRLATVVVAAVLAAGCAGTFPVEPGDVLVVERASPPLAPGDPGYETTLQLRWLGTACYVIRLGDVVVVTDPFVSHQPLLGSLLGGAVVSDGPRVRRAFEDVPPPRAVFVAHSHWDHLLDAAPVLSLPGWEDVPLYGGATTRNILCGYGEGVAAHWREAETDDAWHEAWRSGDGRSAVEYAALPATHAPQALGILAYPGSVDACLPAPPDTAGDFPLGEVYAFLLRLTNAGTSRTVFFMSSASDWPHGCPPDAMLPVDAAVLCVPSWKSADGYPARFLGALRPRDVVLAHYDDFFETDDAAPRRTVALADFEGCLRAVERAATYPRFRRILAPDVGTTVRIAHDADDADDADAPGSLR